MSTAYQLLQKNRRNLRRISRIEENLLPIADCIGKAFPGYRVVKHLPAKGKFLVALTTANGTTEMPEDYVRMRCTDPHGTNWMPIPMERQRVIKEVDIVQINDSRYVPYIGAICTLDDTQYTVEKYNPQHEFLLKEIGKVGAKAYRYEPHAVVVAHITTPSAAKVDTGVMKLESPSDNSAARALSSMQAVNPPDGDVVVKQDDTHPEFVLYWILSGKRRQIDASDSVTPLLRRARMGIEQWEIERTSDKRIVARLSPVFYNGVDTRQSLGKTFEQYAKTFTVQRYDALTQEFVVTDGDNESRRSAEYILRYTGARRGVARSVEEKGADMVAAYYKRDGGAA